MTIEEELAGCSPHRDTLVTIGVFDGVHLGHKYLLSELKKQAAEKNLLSGVVTFGDHPERVVSSQTELPYLTDVAERVGLLKKEDVGFVCVLSFTPEVAGLSARNFVGLLVRHLGMRGLVVGHDFALGRNREGSPAVLRSLGKEMGFTVKEVAARRVATEVVSSTSVRKALSEGDMKRVRRLLGRYFSLRGKVVTGRHVGTGLGFPTANLAVEPGHALPADGVYATRAHIEGKPRPAMTNIGVRPTFGDNAGRTIEVYVMDYRGDLYDKELMIEIIGRVRGEQRFDSVQDLQRQIAKDIQQGKALIHSAGE